MGVTFRSGDYVKFVRFGHRSIKDGEAAAIWNANGVHTQIVGPRRVTLWFSTIRFLYHHQATRQQYLKVEHRDGTVSHLVGPAHLYLNPTLHSNITVKDGYNLATENECLILYRSSNESGETKPESNKGGLSSNRRIVYGPQFVVPCEDETVHTFRWSTTDSGASAAEFQVLKTNKTELWRLTLSVKTRESLKVKVQIAISYKIETVERVLDIADPISYARAAILCDANRGSLSVDDASEWAGHISSYSAFSEAMASCGFRIVKFLVLELALPESLTGKQSAQALEEERQVKASSKLKHDMEMSKLEYEKKRSQAEFQSQLDKVQNQLDSETAEQAAAVKLSAVQHELELDDKRQQAQNEARKRDNETRLDFYRGLQDIGVDVTKVLCARASHGVNKSGGDFHKSLFPGETAGEV